MKDNEEHLSVVKGTKKRLKDVAKKNNRTMRGQLDHMLDEAEKQAVATGHLSNDTRCSYCHVTIAGGIVVEVGFQNTEWRCPACGAWNKNVR